MNTLQTLKWQSYKVPFINFVQLKTIHYHLKAVQRSRKLLQISVTFPVNEATTLLHLPSWRPGRYELGNFAKNVLNFSVFNELKKKCDFQKINKDTWEVNTQHTKAITVSYNYYSAELNAGSTYVDDELIYVNPVNCLIYLPQQVENPINLHLTYPEKWQIASPLKQENGLLLAANYQELIDSPFIASPHLQAAQYTVNSVTFTIWINGHEKVEWEELLSDFTNFTQRQFNAFGEFPFESFAFLIFSLPIAAYHGVEHLSSTVITLGPSHSLFNKLYGELLGISSHELYHAWNVKSIRPVDMQPYKLNQENYSRLGYIYEGVTTYMGDLFLLKSGFFNLETYLEQFSIQVQKHLDNPGRFNYSVAESSFDTWLDGYVSGVPGRKVSIYTEGCLLAFCADVLIRQATNNKSSLDEVMQRLYYDFAIKGLGITQQDYRSALENRAGISFEGFFNQYVEGTNSYERLLIDCLHYLGLELIQRPLASYSASRLGLKTSHKNNRLIITVLYPGSPSEVAGLCLDDQIIAVNDYQITNDFDEVLTYLAYSEKQILVARHKKMYLFTLPEVDRYFYQVHVIQLTDNRDAKQQKALLSWCQ